MGKNMRKAGVVCGSTFAVALLGLSTATSAGAASSALVIGGISTPSLSDVVLQQLLAGSLKNQQRVSVNWPAQAGPYTGSGDMTLGASINVGITNMNAQIAAGLGRLAKDGNGNYINGEKVTVVGLSAGSLVVNEVLRGLAANPNAPDKSQLTFIVVADSSRQKLIDKTQYNPKYDYTYQPAPETEYDIIVVTGEYDGMADFPDRPWNILAVINAIAGGIVVHVPVMFTDLTKVPAQNIDVDVNSKGGTTTHYLVPTAKLPIVALMPWLAPREAELKAKIDKGYARYDAPAAVPASVMRTLVAPAPAVVEDAAVETVEQAPVTAAPEAQPVSAPVEVTAEETATAADTSSDDSADRAETVVADSDDTEADAVTDSDDDAVSAKDDDKAAVTEDKADDAAESSKTADADEADKDSSASNDSSSDDSGSSDSSDSAE